MSKTFNTAGPSLPQRHYMVPSLQRLPDIGRLVDQGRYFVLHGPRRSGKTTALFEAADRLNDEGACRAVYCCCDCVLCVSDPDEAMRMLADSILYHLSYSRGEDFRPFSDHRFHDDLKADPGYAASPVGTCLRRICGALDQELVVFLDEADTLSVPIMAALMSQLRDGYAAR